MTDKHNDMNTGFREEPDFSDLRPDYSNVELYGEKPSSLSRIYDYNPRNLALRCVVNNLRACMAFLFVMPLGIIGIFTIGIEGFTLVLWYLAMITAFLFSMYIYVRLGRKLIKPLPSMNFLSVSLLAALLLIPNIVIYSTSGFDRYWSPFDFPHIFNLLNNIMVWILSNPALYFLHWVFDLRIYSDEAMWFVLLLIAALIPPLSLYLGFYLEQRKQKKDIASEVNKVVAHD